MIIQLGDMLVVDKVPAKLMKALAVIADTLHQEFGRQPWIAHVDKSKESCILCSLAVRDFLVTIGFDDAVMRTVSCIMRATRDGKELHSLGNGMPPDTPWVGGIRPDTPEGKWNGHAVVCVPQARVMIDTTLYHTRRDAWPESPLMVACPYRAPSPKLVYGLKPFAGLGLRDDEDPGYFFEMLWLDYPNAPAWNVPGYDSDPWRRLAVVEAMVRKFGTWTE